MFVIIDKNSTKFYNQTSYVSVENKMAIVFYSSFARKFRTKENAEKFIKKLPREVEYEVVFQKK